MADWTRLKSITEYSASQPSDLLEGSVRSFLEWGLLGIGAFTDVRLPQSGAFGGSPSRLRPASDPYYLPGQCWEGFRSDWVWETGVEYSRQPVAYSGVYVGGAFHPVTGVGPYAHHVDYPRGRVVFELPISTGSVVSAEYSYRAVSVVGADHPFWRAVQYDSLRVDEPEFLQFGSGAWNVLPENRLQLPALVVDVKPEVTQHLGLEIGSQARWQRQSVDLHVLAETPFDRRQLHDVAFGQEEKVFWGLDYNVMRDSGAFPLDDRGMTASGFPTYPQLVGTPGGYRWKLVTVLKARSNALELVPPLYGADVHWSVELVLP